MPSQKKHGQTVSAMIKRYVKGHQVKIRRNHYFFRVEKFAECR